MQLPTGRQEESVELRHDDDFWNAVLNPQKVDDFSMYQHLAESLIPLTATEIPLNFSNCRR